MQSFHRRFKKEGGKALMPFSFSKCEEMSEAKAGILLIHKTHSNIYLTLCDAEYKVLGCKTSGMARVGRRKKRKVSPQAVEAIFSKLKKYFRHFKLSVVCLELRLKPSIYSFLLIKQLRKFNIRIETIEVCLKTLHTRVRGRKARRI